MELLIAVINLFDLFVGNINSNLEFSNSSIETILFITHWATYIISLSCYLLYRAKLKENVEIKCLKAGSQIFLMQGIYWTTAGIAATIDNPFVISLSLLFSVPSTLMILSYITAEPFTKICKLPVVISLVAALISFLIYRSDLSVLSTILNNGYFTAYNIPIAMASIYPFFVIILKCIKSKRFGLVKTSRVSAVTLSILNIISFIHFAGFRLDANHLSLGYGLIFVTYMMYFAYIITETFVTIHENSAISNNLSILMHDYGKNNLFYIENASKLLAKRYISKLPEKDREKAMKQINNIELKARETYGAISTLRESEKEFFKNSIDIKNFRTSFKSLLESLKVHLSGRVESAELNVDSELENYSFIISSIFVNKILYSKTTCPDKSNLTIHLSSIENRPRISIKNKSPYTPNENEVFKIKTISSKLGVDALYIEEKREWIFVIKNSLIQKYSDSEINSNIIDVQELFI